MKMNSQEVNDFICQKIDSVKLTNENIKKMLNFDMDIGGIDYDPFVCGGTIFNYGLDDAKYDISFKDYIKEFKGVCDWAIAGGGACEEPEILLKKFNDLNLTFQEEVENVNVKEVYKQMNEKEKKAMLKLFFEEEVDEFYNKYDDKDALIQKDEWNMFMTCDENYYLQDDIHGDAPIFNPSSLATKVSVKWVAKYHFAECLKDKGCEQTQKAIKEAIPDANIVIVTPEVLNDILVEEVKEKIINKLI